MSRILRFLFYTLFVRLVVLVIVGLNVRHRKRLPDRGPAIIVANHNSHLDTMVLLTLMPSRLLPVIRPVGAMDYFFRNRLLAWFAVEIIGIIPVKRNIRPGDADPFIPCYEALAKGHILIFFPEGTRGEPEKRSKLHPGITSLAVHMPEVPVIPVFLHGLGKVLPKGEALLVPFFCDVFIGKPLYWTGDKHGFMRSLEESFQHLSMEGKFSKWD